MRMGLSGERLSRAGVARISCIWVLIAGVATGSLAFADVEDLPVFYLGEVVVTSDRIPKEGPTTISEVAAGDIQRQNATNLGEALKLVPSLHFHQARCKAGFYGTLRGFEQEGVLVLLDGIPIGVPYEALVNLPDIPSENIAKIKVVKGTPSLLYGPNALGGVINVITKRGEETPSGSFSYQISDYNTHHIEVSHGWKLGPLSYRFGLSHRESDGYTMADDFELPENVISSMESSPARPGTLPNVPIAPDGGRRANSDYERDAFTLTSSIDLGSNNTLAMALEHYRNVYGVPPIPVLREHKNGFFYFPRYWRFTNWKRFTVNVIEESRPTSSLRIKTRLFYDQYENTLDAYDGPTLNTQDRQGPPSGTSVYDDYSRGGKLHVFWHGLPRNELRLGIGVVEDVHRGTFLDDPTDRFVSYTTSIALEDEIRLGRRLAVTAGVSYDMFDKNSRTQEGTGQDPGEDVKTFSPQAGISFDASPSVNLYASVGKRVRFPTMRNLYASGVIGPEGDPDLEEMSTINYELGGTCEVAEDVTAGAALFYSDVSNLISCDNLIGRFQQFEDASLAGLEANLSVQSSAGLAGRMAYTYLRARSNSTVTIENAFHPALVYKPEKLPYRPTHKIDLELSRRLASGTLISMNASYISEQTFYNHADAVDNTIMAGDEESLDGYLLLNLRVAREIASAVQVHLAVENVLNQEYFDIDMFPRKGRTIWGGVRIGR